MKKEAGEKFRLKAKVNQKGYKAKFYSTNKKVAVVNSNGVGHGALAGFLQEQNVIALICGGIGGGARQALMYAGIQLFPGAHGNADAAVAALLKGELLFDPNIMCDHHHHEDGHSCGSHGCGEHSCGGCH